VTKKKKVHAKISAKKGINLKNFSRIFSTMDKVH